MGNKLKYDDVKTYIENEGYELLSKEYINAREKLLLKCPNGHEYKISFSKFKSGRRCGKCSNEKRKLTYSYVKMYIENEGYELLSNSYEGTKYKMLMKCNYGHEFEMNFSNFKQGKRCPVCSYKKRRLTQKEVYNKMIEKGYELLSEYEDQYTILKIKCPEGHIYEDSYFGFIHNRTCTECKKIKKKNRYNEVKKYIESFDYKLLSKEYNSNKEKILVKCNHGHEYEVKFDNFQQGYRCPICNLSKGEDKIKLYLDTNNIENISQFKFNGCKFKYKLPFDFYLPKYNLCIEYDGIQHFEIVKHFGGYDGFITRKIKDTIKNIYCKNNNINLIRIPYWEYDNIENILNEIINKLDDTFND